LCLIIPELPVLLCYLRAGYARRSRYGLLFCRRVSVRQPLTVRFELLQHIMLFEITSLIQRSCSTSWVIQTLIQLKSGSSALQKLKSMK